ncbi:MAG: hypothetical protein M3530_02890 [Thermoproteota archaeon]|nr:hypothetical protein [Thermoproteota archaeon]
MLKGEKTWATIMKELHVGPHTIEKVQESIRRSEAFEMLERNCTLHEVSLKLDISSDKVKKYHLEYLDLKGQDELVRLLRDKDISNLVPIAREIKARRLTVEQIENGLKLSSSVRQLEDKRREISDCIGLERNKYAKLCEEKSITENQVDNLMKRKGRLLEETGIFESRLEVCRLAIEKIRSSKEITNLQEIVQNIARSFLDDNKILLAVAASAISRTIAANPQSLALFSDPAATETLALFFLDPGPPGNEIWISKIANSIIKANIVFLMNGILLGTINALGDKKFETVMEKVKAEMAQFMILRKHYPLLSSMFEN